MKKYIFISLVFLLIPFIISCSKTDNNLIDISNKSVRIISPTQPELTDHNVLFEWERLEGAEEYRLKVKDIRSNIFVDTVLTGTHITIPLSLYNDNSPTPYTGFLSARNSLYETKLESMVLFTLILDSEFINYEVNIIEPEDYFVTNQQYQTFSWESVTDAETYLLEIWYYDDWEFFIGIEGESTGVSQYLPEGDFLWRVRAQTYTNHTAYSSRNILVDTTNPNTPILLSPENNSTQPEGNITFSWDRSAIDGSVEIDSLFVYNDANLTNLTFKDQVASNSFSIDLTSGEYYWVMKAYDEAGNQSNYSDVFGFTID